MKNVDRCVVCEGTIFTRKRAIVSPFLARRIWNRSSMAIHLAQCQVCGFLFFNPRLEADEEHRLYASYRQPEYQQMRQSCEPWYTPKFNASISSPGLMEMRRRELASILKTHLRGVARPAILDFGGDRGLLIRGVSPDSAGYVYDISGAQPVDGVEVCRNLADCRSREFDLVVCSNVLEHVGFPRTVMDQITSIAAPKTMVFLEVPYESPFGARLLLRRLIQYGILALTRPAVALSVARPGLLYPMHEHINYFTPGALTTLMVKSGWSVVASGTYVLESALGGKATWCIGRLAQNGSNRSAPA
jgi:hypothetical protein